MKKLEINCGTCDATGLREEMLSGYESVEINCGSLFVTPTAQAVLLNHAAELNTGTVLTVPEGVELISRIGSFTLTPADVQARPAFLLVTGSLTVEPGAGAAADSFAAVHVTGSLVCPRSDHSSKIHVIGNETIYPDGYIYVDGGIVLDRAFRIRYAGKKVYTQRTVTVGDPSELPAMVEAGTKVLCGRLVVTEGQLEEVLKVAEPEKPGGLVVIPDGFIYLAGRCKLTKREARRGKKLWIDGDMILERRDAQVLSELEALHVTGRAVIPEDCEERFEELDPDCGDILAYRGALVWGRDETELTRSLLEREGFVMCLNCDCVALDKSLTPEEIRNGLAIVDCGVVVCAPEQENAVREVCEDVDEIETDGKEQEDEEDEPEGEQPDVTEINCGTYKF